MKIMCFVRAATVCVLAVGLSGAAKAATDIWIAGTGNFNTAANWDTGTAPAGGDDTTFTNDTSYTVTFGSPPATVNSNVFNGHAGTVTLDIGSQTWNVTNVFSVGQGANTTATVAQASGTLNIPTNGSFVVGDSGVGTYLLTNGTVRPFRTVVGLTKSGRGTLIVSGSGVFSTDSFISPGGGTLIIGRVAGATGNTMIISNNASISSWGATLGFNAAATNNSIVMTPGTFWFGWTRPLVIGGYKSTLIVNGATISESGTFLVGHGTGGALGVGDTVILTNNAYLLSGYGNPRIGNQGSTVAGGTYGNTMIVTHGAIWDAGSDGPKQIIVGASGNSSNNTLLIKNGGMVTNCTVRIGDSSTINFGSNSNSVYVIDGGKLFSGLLDVGNGQMTTGSYYQVGGIGSPSIVSNSFINMGNDTNCFGNRMVITNATLRTTITCRLGNLFNASSNVVEIMAGGTWDAGFTNVVVGNSQSPSNLVRVTGGVLTNVGRLTIGSGNTTNASIANTVTVLNGGQIVNCGRITLASNTNDCFNTLSVGVGGTVTVISNIAVGANDATPSNAFTITGGKVTARSLQVRTTNIFTFSSGTLSVGGTTFATGANNGTPAVMGDGSSAAIFEMVAGDTGFHSFSNGVVIANNATLRGTGTVVGDLTVLGTLSPGLSVGTVTTSNDLVLGSSAVLAYELGASSDLTIVNSNLTLDGTVNVTDSGGFTNNNYTLISYAGTLTDNGLSVGVLPGGFSGSISNDTAGKLVVLVVTIGGGDPFAAWQTAYFGSTSCTLCAGNADFDGDGISNTNEFLSGTVPTNTLSGLRITSVARASNNITITWSTAGGHTNIVQVTSGGAGGNYNTNNFVDILASKTIVTGSGNATTNYVDVGGGTNGPSRYYRVRLVP